MALNLAAWIGFGGRRSRHPRYSQVLSSTARRYRFGELLGEGGFGVVYKAAMLGSDGFEKPVAIKLLRLGGGDGRLAEEAQQRFRDEARLLGLLRHRAIVQVDGLVRIGGHQAVVMEYLEGVSLRALVKRAPIPERPSLEIVAEVAAALDAVWHRPGPAGKPLNVCHRDLKPANLQLSSDGELKVLDFGIARANFQARETETSSLAMGSVEYMSPKRLDFDDDGAAGDIYSLGCVLFELLVGEPFGRTSANPKSHAQRFEANIVRAPEGCREMIAKMLAYEPTERPSARELERRCLDLARSQGMGLRDWAAEAVPACLSSAIPASGSWTGKLLAEDGDGPPPPPPPAEVRPRYVLGGGSGAAPAVSADRAEVAGARGIAEPPAKVPSPTSRPEVPGPVTAAARASGPITRSGPLHSGALHSGALHSGALHSGALHSGALHSGALHSGALHSGALHSGSLHSGSLHSGSLRSGPVRPGGGGSNTAARRSGPVTGSRKAGAAARAGVAALGVVGMGSIAAGFIVALVAGALALRELGAPQEPALVDVAGPADPGVHLDATALLPGSHAASPHPEGTPAGVTVAAPAPSPAPGPAPSRIGVGSSAASAVKPEPVPTPVDRPAAAKVTPVADPGTSATVELSGNAESVRLRSSVGTFSLPVVPAGTYTVLATFDGKEIEAGSVSFGEGEAVVLKCKQAFLRCTR